MGLQTRESQTFLQVIADGSIRMQVPEGTEGSVRREYEDKDGNKQFKIEAVFNAIDGMLGDITVKAGKFGDQIMVPITDQDSGEVYTLALGTSSNFGEDFMKKLPNINLAEPVLLAPFSFIGDNGKDVRGMDIRQGFDVNVPNSGEKAANHYRDAEAKRNINGMPTPEGDTRHFNTDDWKVYFITVRKFLIADLTEKGIIKTATASAVAGVVGQQGAPIAAVAATAPEEAPTPSPTEAPAEEEEDWTQQA